MTAPEQQAETPKKVIFRSHTPHWVGRTGTTDSLLEHGERPEDYGEIDKDNSDKEN